MNEAIRNSRLHSGAATADVSIQVAGSPPSLAVSARDSGRGFDPSGIDSVARLGLMPGQAVWAVVKAVTFDRGGGTAA